MNREWHIKWFLMLLIYFCYLEPHILNCLCFLICFSLYVIFRVPKSSVLPSSFYWILNIRSKHTRINKQTNPPAGAPSDQKHRTLRENPMRVLASQNSEFRPEPRRPWRQHGGHSLFVTVTKGADAVTPPMRHMSTPYMEKGSKTVFLPLYHNMWPKRKKNCMESPRNSIWQPVPSFPRGFFHFHS